MSMAWIAVGSAVLGAGTSLYGANKQSKANQAATSANQQSQAEQNASAWASYLMSRGVNPNGVATGQIPTNPTAINAKLPLWANVSRSRTPSVGFRLPGRSGPKLAINAPAQPAMGASRPFMP